MADISWASWAVAAFSEEERAAAIAPVTILPPGETYLPPQPPRPPDELGRIVDPEADAGAAPYPWGFRTPEEWVSLGYVYIAGEWVLASSVRDVPVPPGDPPGGGGKPVASVIAGSGFPTVRITQGISGGAGALGPISFGSWPQIRHDDEGW